VALISLGGPGIVECRTSSAAPSQRRAELRADVLLDFSIFVAERYLLPVSKPHAHAHGGCAAQGICSRFGHEVVDHITVDPNVAIVAVVGGEYARNAGVAGRSSTRSVRKSEFNSPIAQGSSETNIRLSWMINRCNRRCEFCTANSLWAIRQRASRLQNFVNVTPHPLLVTLQRLHHGVL